ncbi:MAG: potassium-transporting ATPase subunit KdpC [Eubacteriaceae bacterium]
MSKNKNLEFFRPVLSSFLILTIICGGIYPLFVTGIAQLFFPFQANGSILEVKNQNTSVILGSEIIGQSFSDPQYLIGRPTMPNGKPSNISGVSSEQKAFVEKRIAWWQELDPENKKEIPMDLVTVSGSGVDPEISLAGAEYQIDRIARERGLSIDEVKKVIDKYTKAPILGFLGEPVVNVLMVNKALDGLN